VYDHLSEESMIRFKLSEAMAEYGFQAGRRVEWREVSEATGIHRSTLSKMLNTRGYNATTDSIDRLCAFFGCKVEDLMVHVPESQPAAEALRP
jgi:DNA-binding Xre family transcriptional regulator